MKAQSRWFYWCSGITIAASLSALISHAWLGTYSRFIADDFCSAAEEHRLGILRAAWYWYTTWTGRYSANLADAIFGALGPGFTPFVTSLVVLIWLAALCVAIYLLLPSCDKRTRGLVALALATTILFLTLTITSNVQQSLYWNQGMRSVVPPLILGTMYVSLYKWVIGRSESAKNLNAWSLLSLVLANVAGGFSETFSAIQVLAFLLASGYLIVLNRKLLNRASGFMLTSGLLGSILGLISVIFAPGNPFRQAYFPPPPSLLVISDISFRSFSIYWLGMLSQIQKLVGLFAAIGVGFTVGASIDWKFKNRLTPILVLVFGIGLVFACFPPSAYGISDAPPERTLIIPSYILLVTLIVLGIFVGSLFIRSIPLYQIILVVSTFLILVTAAFSISQMLSSRKSFVNYADAWSAFNTQLIAARSAKLTQIVVSTDEMNQNNWSGLDVMGDNPKFWVNKCVSTYYGLSVTSNSPPP